MIDGKRCWSGISPGPFRQALSTLPLSMDFSRRRTELLRRGRRPVSETGLHLRLFAGLRPCRRQDHAAVLAACPNGHLLILDSRRWDMMDDSEASRFYAPV